MIKFLDYILIVALLVNIGNSLMNYAPNTEVFGSSIPTWLAIAIQVACIALIVYNRFFRKNATEE